MKNLKFSFLFTLFLSTPSVFFAQLTPKGVESKSLISETEKVMSQGTKNSLSVNLSKANAKFAEKIWKDFIKQYKGDYKRDKKNDEYFLDNAMIAGIGGGNTVDMYMKFNETNDNTTATLWIDLGGAYLNSKDFKDKYSEAEKMMFNYAITVSKEQTKIQLEDQQKALKKLESDQKSLEKKNASLLADIEDYKKKIAKAEEDIKTNLKQQEETKVKIESQKKIVDEVQIKLNNLN
jgi:DNA-binding helix-hairpin-helix protein with protein kinase domain